MALVNPSNESRVDFAQGLGRAFGGALLFSLPMFLTIELWWLGFYLDRLRLMVLLVLMFPVLVGVSHFRGFRPTFGWKDDLIDACVAYSVGFTTAAVILPIFSVLQAGMSLNEIIGKIATQAIPASMGALLARSQFRSGPQRGMTRQPQSYGGKIFLAAVGALYMALNLAPTQEMILLAQKVSWRQAMVLLGLSLVLMQAFTYAIDRQSTASAPVPLSTSFFSYTVAGFAVALLIGLYMLWSFSRTDGLAVEQIMREVLVLGFPVAVGAAGSRLIL
jgi:putative integral membrane protein (TIGR02587 family)